MLNDEQLAKLRKAGEVSAAARDLGISLCKPGAKLLDIAQEVEGYIRDHGCGVAFPCNLSINEVAAHYTPTPNDQTRLEIGDVIKVDCGAVLDGYIGDTAATVEVATNAYRDLVEASKRARNTVAEFVGEGTPIREIGRAIEMSIKRDGYNVVENLCGHQIDYWDLHAGYSIPPYDAGDETVIQAGQTFAVEPFATNGRGSIDNGKPGNIVIIFEFMSASICRRCSSIIFSILENGSSANADANGTAAASANNAAARAILPVSQKNAASAATAEITAASLPFHEWRRTMRRACLHDGSSARSPALRESAAAIPRSIDGVWPVRHSSEEYIESALAHSPATVLSAASFILPAGKPNSSKRGASSDLHAFFQRKSASSSSAHPGSSVMPSGMGSVSAASPENASAACEAALTCTGIPRATATRSYDPVGEEYENAISGKKCTPSFTGRTR